MIRGGNKSDTNRILPFPHMFSYFKKKKSEYECGADITQIWMQNCRSYIFSFGNGTDIRK
jgi:hypothetical protein